MYLFMYVYKDMYIYIYVYIMYLYIHIHAHLFLFVQVHQCLLTTNFLCLSKTAKTVRSPLVAELLHRLFFSSNHSPGVKGPGPFSLPPWMILMLHRIWA